MRSVDFTYPTNVCFECNGCGLCCGDTPQKKRCILLLDSEVKKISAETHLLIDDFAKEVADRTPYIYEMKKPWGKCFFLKNNCCNIYEFRPLICRFYPFDLRFNPDRGIYVFNYTLECPAINKGGKLIVKQDFELLFLLAEERLPC
ncbi:MAG: YkgJ family cysteine cluster protein [Nitrososphaerota archaeon]|nr:YkgJ family cysteine cluster protein [Nitrososphaerota archaeon]